MLGTLLLQRIGRGQVIAFQNFGGGGNVPLFLCSSVFVADDLVRVGFLTRDEKSRRSVTHPSVKVIQVHSPAKRANRSYHFKNRGKSKWDKVAAEFESAHSIVSQLLIEFQITGTVVRQFSCGLPRATIPVNDQYIALKSKNNRKQTAREIANKAQAIGDRGQEAAQGWHFGFLVMNDNAAAHCTVDVEELLDSEDTECMNWLAKSPDLSPILKV
ncbi:hypothetical protein TNCV_4387171 [Trichonephila clavipes]|nr:hypothetical protein TNCV_4387171 [Trichonephila clavipes]